MAYMCADSGNLMAIAQQVIQQKQQRQQQQQQQQQQMAVASMPSPPPLPWGEAAAHSTAVSDQFPFMLHDPTPSFIDPFAASAEHPFDHVFESDDWMDSLIDESQHQSSGLMADALFADSELNSVLFATKAGPPVEPQQHHYNIAPATALPVLSPPKIVGQQSVASSPAQHPLFKCLLECARFADSDPELAIKSLAQIRESASDVGGSTQRVAFYFAQGLHYRLIGQGVSQQPCFDYSSEEFTLCYKALNDACPYYKFAHFTANQAILEATETASRIHIIDFGIVQGIQWAALLQALATRTAGKPSKIRISGISSPSLDGARAAPSLASSGKRLRDFAELLELEFEFDQILTPIDELTVSTFRIHPDESVVVNFMLQLHYLLGDSAESVEQVLRLAKSIGPRVVTLCEYELSSNEANFPNRFANALYHFASIFESFEPAMDRDSTERRRLERNLFVHRILETLGSTGSRLRMEGKDKWRIWMKKCGFESLPIGNYAVSQAKLLLWNYSYSKKYSLLDAPPGFLSLAWSDNPIITVSSWR